MSIKVMCFGVFDRLHPGHISFLKQAKNCGDRLIVLVARDKNVILAKGKKPIQNEKIRQRNIIYTKIADKVILGKIRNKYEVVKIYQPEIICLGYDQQVKIKELKKIFSGKIIRLRPYRKNIYKSSLM